MAEETYSEDNMEEDIPLDMVQINASMKEINNRITQFILYKRAQADRNNVLEFCKGGVSCARVDAALARRKDSSSHLAVRNVLDRYTSKYKSAEKPRFIETLVNPAIQEQRSKVSTKGQKRTYDVASLESMLIEEKNQHTT